MLTSEEKRELWFDRFNDPERDGRVNDSIEKNRKGFCKIRLVDENGGPLKDKRFRIGQKTHDFKYGANIFMLDEFKDEELNKKYRETFKEYFNLATVPFYWDGLEPEEGRIRFDRNSPKIYRRPAPELCVEYCEENGIDAKLHCLVYDKFIPEWLPRDDEKAMEKLYEKRIREIAERYSGRLVEFEVINETLSEPNWKYKSAISRKRDVLEWAFGLARKYLPNETLVINEGKGLKDISVGFRSPYFMQIENTLQKGTTIDKIGFQYHIFTGSHAKTPEEYEASFRKDAFKTDPAVLTGITDILSPLGLPLEATEVTIPTPGDTPDDEELQAQMLKRFYSLWFATPLVDTVVYWNTADGTAYQSDVSNENNCRGGLFRSDLTPKRSALMLKKLFSETWRTETELVTDDCGYAEFRGFFGDYEAEVDGVPFEFGLHKNEANVYEFLI